MISCRNECTWNGLIKDFVKKGEYKHAFVIFQKMRKNSIHVEIYTYVALIKACAKSRDLEKGQEIHNEVYERGLEKELLVGSTLVSMYASCGLLTKAQSLFDKLPVQDVVLWNTLILGYMQHGQSEEALRCVYRMHLEGFYSDNVTYIVSLKACASIGAVHRSQELHTGIIVQNYLEADVKVGNALVDMYTKCGLFSKAKEVLYKLPVQDTISWNALISGYTKQGLAEEALHCYEQMHLEGVFPDPVTMACSLKACGSIIAVVTGLRIHVEISKKGILDRDIVVGNALVDMYAKCGMLQNALAVFNKLACKDAVSWTVLITGYAQHGYGNEALSCFEQMQMHGISPDAVTLLCSLKACSTTGDVNIGCEIHAEIARRDFMERDLISNALIDMYAKCNLLANAQEIFDRYSMRNVVSWNALIGGYAQHGYGEEALDCFQQMELEGIPLDAVTFVCALNACGIERAICIGHKIHAEIARRGLLGNNIVLGNALVDMYAKCGAFVRAWEVFDSLSVHDAATWNALTAGYIEQQLFEEALDCFMWMQQEGVVVPDAATYVCTLKACGMKTATFKGIEIHAEVCRRGFHKDDLVIGNVLVDMYCNCGLLAMAEEVFDNLPFLDVISWTVLLAGYARHGLHEEALCVFNEMQHEGFAPSIITYVCMLSACGSLGALEMGLDMHAEIARKRLLEQDLTAGNALLDMYASCGLLANAQETFGSVCAPSIISWSSLIAGYAQIGAMSQVFHMLKEMETEDEPPNSVTFVSILNACSHAGQVDEGQVYFEAMSEYSLIPSLEHHTCMLDLFSRAGQLYKAVCLLKAMPFIPNVVTWHTMLGACKKWHEQELGREAFDNAMRLDERDGAALVCMWNIFADASMQKEAAKS